MTKSKEKVLVVDDEADIRELLAYELTKAGFEVATAHDGRMAMEKAIAMQPDFVLLDIMMPIMDGIEVCRKIRETKALANAFIIILTARGEEYSEVAGFEAGANDYIVKPVKIRSLISRLQSFRNRPTQGSSVSGPFQRGKLTIDPDQYLLILDDKKIRLPKKEFELLLLLAKSPNKIVRRDRILEEVWGKDVVVGGRTIDVHVRRIRKKIGEEKIATIKGVGYKFQT